jgi:hypothetical protein
MALIWWEKTVEYKFILEYLPAYLTVAPLDGNQERWGDAVFQAANWHIIEFKRNEASLKDEIGKYDDYDGAYAALSDADAHHLLVHGTEVEGGLQLEKQTYFSRVSVEYPFEHGASHEDFTSYLKVLSSYKKGAATSSGGGLSSVMGISSNADRIVCLSLDECLHLALGTEPPPPEQTYQPISRSSGPKF